MTPCRLQTPPIHAARGLSTDGSEAEKRVRLDALVAMPDLRHEVQEVIAEADTEMARVVVTGTLLGISREYLETVAPSEWTKPSSVTRVTASTTCTGGGIGMRVSCEVRRSLGAGCCSFAPVDRRRVFDDAS